MAHKAWTGIFFLLALVFAQKSKKKKSADDSSQDSTGWRAAAGPYTKGVAYFSMGLSEEALAYFLNALEKAPNSAGIHHYLAQIAYTQRDYPRMLTHAEKAYREAPEELWLALGYAYALFLNEEHREAISLLEKVLQTHPDHPEILIRLAQSYRRLGRLTEADRYYEKIQQRGGVLYDDFFQERIQMFVEAGELGRAIALTETLIARWPRTEIYRETAIRLYELARDLPRMADHIQELLAIDAASPLAWDAILSNIEWFESRWDDQVWDSLLSKSEVPVEVRYALLRRFSDEGVEVRQRIDQLLREMPTAEGWAFRAELWLEEDERDSAAFALREAIRLDSTHWEWWARWLHLLYQLGGGDSLERAILVVSERFPQQGILYLWRGILYGQRRQPTDAIAAFQRGWTLTPIIDTSIARLALFYEGMAYLLSKTSWPAPYETRLNAYHTPTETTLLRYLIWRYSDQTPPPSIETEARRALSLLPATHPLRLWTEGLLSPSNPDWQKRLSDNLPLLPLEGWIMLLPQGPAAFGPLTYQTWKNWVIQTYPLCPAWQKLP